MIPLTSRFSNFFPFRNDLNHAYQHYGPHIELHKDKYINSSLEFLSLHLQTLYCAQTAANFLPCSLMISSDSYFIVYLYWYNAGHLCDLAAGFTVSQNLFRLFDEKGRHRKDVTNMMSHRNSVFTDTNNL